MKAFGRLLDVLDILREECPWDRKQTNESLRPNTIEETYELCEALAADDNENICKELGDVLLHVCFYAKIGQEKGLFDIEEVCNRLTDKLIYRHPHIYDQSQVGAEFPLPISACADIKTQSTTSQQVLENWEKLKLKEKDGNKSVLAGVPTALPSLIKAYRIQDKARNVGFDWEERKDVWTKVHEELEELETELEKNDHDRAAEEYGDFLFSVVNAGRLYKINPETALDMTNRKFMSRFNYIEQHAKKIGKQLTDMSLQEMDELWNEAKINSL